MVVYEPGVLWFESTLEKFEPAVSVQVSQNIEPRSKENIPSTAQWPVAKHGH